MILKWNLRIKLKNISPVQPAASSLPPFDGLDYI